jgi:hypothetical protein
LAEGWSGANEPLRGMTATRPCRLRVALRSKSGTGPVHYPQGCVAACAGPSGSWPGALDVVPGWPHRLLEGPRLPALPFEVAAAKVVAQRLPGAGLEQMPATDEIQRGSAGPSPPTSMIPARRPCATRTLPGIRSPWVITSPAVRGSARRTAHMRRSRGTSRSCALRSKQVSIHASWDRSSPPRPCPLNTLPLVSIARTPPMHSARSWATSTDLPGSWSVAAVPGSQVCTDHGRGSPLPVRRVRPARASGPCASQHHAGCLGLGLEPPPRRCNVPRFYRKPGHEPVADANERIDRPR